MIRAAGSLAELIAGGLSVEFLRYQLQTHRRHSDNQTLTPDDVTNTSSAAGHIFLRF